MDNAEVKLPDMSVDDLCRMIGDRDVQITRLTMLAQRQANELQSLQTSTSNVSKFDDTDKKTKVS
jgi:hypothetical protein